MLTTKQLQEIFVNSKTLTETKFKNAVKQAKKSNLSVEQYLIDKKGFHDEVLYKMAADYYKYNYIDLSKTRITKKILVITPESLAQKNQVVIFEKDDKKKIIKIATACPHDYPTIEFLERKTGYMSEIYVTTPANIKKAVDQYRKTFEQEFKELLKTTEDEEIKF